MAIDLCQNSSDRTLFSLIYSFFTLNGIFLMLSFFLVPPFCPLIMEPIVQEGIEDDSQRDINRQSAVHRQTKGRHWEIEQDNQTNRLTKMDRVRQMNRVIYIEAKRGERKYKTYRQKWKNTQTGIEKNRDI